MLIRTKFGYSARNSVTYFMRLIKNLDKFTN